MAAKHESEYISPQQLKWITEHGGKDRFFCGWQFYKDSPYAAYARHKEYWGMKKPEVSDKSCHM